MIGNFRRGMMIALNSRARKGEDEKEGGEWKNLRGGGRECRLQENGGTCCTMCKRD